MLALKLILLCLVVCCVQSQKWKCVKEDEKELDEIVSFLFTIGRKDRRFPLNGAEMKDYCKDQKKYLQKMETYKDSCLKERPKQVFAIIIYSMKTVITNYCRNVKSKRTLELLSSAKCANTNLNSYQVCHVNLINILMEISNLKADQNREKLAQLCCGYNDALSCIQTTALKSGCSEKHTNTNLDFIRNYFDGAINTLCGDYSDHSDKCDGVVRIKPKEHKNRPKSVFQPAVEILMAL